MGFTWHSYLYGPGLALNGTFVALIDRVDDGVRVCLHPNMPNRMRYEFVADEAEGRRYIEAWARRWEAELQELYGPGGATE